MKRIVIVAMSLMLAIGMTSCGSKKEDEKIIGGADEPTTIEVPSTVDKINSDKQEKISDDQALEAIKKYCLQMNPELEDMVKSDDYTIYWNVESSDDKKIVVAYRSYTGAIVRYYIDSVSGETYVTEFVSGITDGEERTDETLNVRDYM